MSRIVRILALTFLVAASGYYVVTRFVLRREAPLEPRPLGPVAKNESVPQREPLVHAFRDAGFVAVTAAPPANRESEARVAELRRKVDQLEEALRHAGEATRELEDRARIAQERSTDALAELQEARLASAEDRKRLESLAEANATLQQTKTALEQKVAQQEIELANHRSSTAPKAQQFAAASDGRDERRLAHFGEFPSRARSEKALNTRISIPLVVFGSEDGVAAAQNVVDAIVAELANAPTARVRIELPSAAAAAGVMKEPTAKETAETFIGRYLRDQIVTRGIPAGRITIAARSKSGGSILGIAPLKASGARPRREEPAVDLVIVH